MLNGFIAKKKILMHFISISEEKDMKKIIFCVCRASNNKYAQPQACF
jgi:hypothetical protein